MAIDVEALRHDTPLTRSLTHANNAGCSVAPRQVIDAVVKHLWLEAQVGGYEAESQRRASLDSVYDQVAMLFGCAADEVGLFESGTVAWKAALDAIGFRSGDRILITTSEFGPNLSLYGKIVTEKGVRVEVVPDTDQGGIDTEALIGMLDDNVRLMIVPLVPANGSIVNPVSRIASLLRPPGAILAVDACQAAGLFPLTMAELGCDILVFSGRKYLRGPRGTGGLVMRRALFDQVAAMQPDAQQPYFTAVSKTFPSKSLSTVRDLETREAGIAGRLGLGAAISYALQVGVADIFATTNSLAGQLRQGLHSIDRLILHGKGAVSSPIVSFSIDGVSPKSVKEHLGSSAINVGLSYRQNTPLDAEARDLPDGVRISVHCFNTSDEVSKIISAVSAHCKVEH